jgi:PAS domain S-box-containing protein
MMRLLPHTSFAHKITLIGLLASSMASATLTATFLAYDHISFHAQLKRRLSTLADVVGENSVAALLFDDRRAATEVLQAFHADPPILSACLYTQAGGLFAQYRRTAGGRPCPQHLIRQLAVGPDYASVTQTVQTQGDVAGTLQLISDMQQIRDRWRHLLEVTGALWGLSLLVGGVTGSLLQQRISHPVRALAQAMHEVTEHHHFGTRVAITGTDEISQLGSGFNAMLGELERHDAERARSEDKLRQLSTVVEQSPISLLITDAAGQITYVNHKFSQLTGYSPAEVLRKTPQMLLDAGYSPLEMYTMLCTAIREGKEARAEFRTHEPGGETSWKLATARPITGPDGEITHFLLIKEDITERMQLELELRQAQKLEGIGQLAAGIAHEINTPTQFVTDNLTFLEESWERAHRLLELYRHTLHANGLSPQTAALVIEAEQACDLDFIGKEVPRAIAQSLEGARRVARIVRAMKEFSHPGLAEKSAIDLNKNIELTTTIARSEWKYVSEVVMDLDPALPPVRCYPGDINQVVLNLVVNAAQAIKEKLDGHGKGQITIRTRKHGRFAEIAISDTGAGVPEEIRARIFEPFFTTKEVGTGTGQGLALAHTVVVKKHQGKIWFDTEVGSGTTFFLHLPIHDLPQ